MQANRVGGGLGRNRPGRPQKANLRNSVTGFPAPSCSPRGRHRTKRGCFVFARLSKRGRKLRAASATPVYRQRRCARAAPLRPPSLAMAPPPGPVVLITGVSEGGIGASLAAWAARGGATVFGTVRRQEAAGGLAALGVTVLPLDVTQPAACAAAVDAVVAAAGRIDVLVNNAGAARGGQPVSASAAAQAQAQAQPACAAASCSKPAAAAQPGEAVRLVFLAPSC